MYDLAIIGAGSAGLPAGIYASRYKIKNIIIGEMLGGALTQSHLVENYPGFEHISGKELMDKFLVHARESGSEVLNDRVSRLEKTDKGFELSTSSGKEIFAKKILIAIGNKYRCLGLEEEAGFIGRGVSYCATCDGMFFKGREVAIVGGGNTALTEALYLSEICSKVHVIHRKPDFRAEKVLIDTASKHENIIFHMNEKVEKIGGGFYLENILLSSGKELKVDGLFVAIGNEPDTSLFTRIGIELDEEGYIVVDKRQQTSIPGIYAAGDITTNSNKFKQTLISAAEGALAASSIHEDLIKE
ncbi:MAG: FAD-dependent oxidoreductase [Candidatus Gracilibacteria bacterium]|nr:FAD-dependent oxidoreductase [Candidatus Gracilibacteria bacterium]MDD2908834.1 FAD-dependent oxidoreductase [Candidatus Gracilibacteria bacterium]